MRECAWRGSGVCYNPPQIIRGSTCLIVMESTHPPPRFIELKRDLSIIQGAREGTHVKGQLFFRTSSRPKIKDREVVKHGKSAPSGSSACIYNSQRFRWKTLASGLSEARGEKLLDLGPMELARCLVAAASVTPWGTAIIEERDRRKVCRGVSIR